MSAEIISMLLVINEKETWYNYIQRLYNIRSDSEKEDIEKKQKFTFLLISTSKDSLCSGIHFYETAIIFL